LVGARLGGMRAVAGTDGGRGEGGRSHRGGRPDARHLLLHLVRRQEHLPGPVLLLPCHAIKSGAGHSRERQAEVTRSTATARVGSGSGGVAGVGRCTDAVAAVMRSRHVAAGTHAMSDTRTRVPGTRVSCQPLYRRATYGSPPVRLLRLDVVLHAHRHVALWRAWCGVPGHTYTHGCRAVASASGGPAVSWLRCTAVGHGTGQGGWLVRWRLVG
jgi:hypothetical protein